ncbi:rRNA maturation RNase YbeY [Candidatus Uhrbacteria bacterium]|nr:rRNA maturation RNase YbeY [Candidatus Uhrbacteria bacterium]
MISCVIEAPLEKELKKTGIARKGWYRDIHTVVMDFLKKNPRRLKRAYDISIILIGKEKMRALHAAYKKVNRVTDVLSFFYERTRDDRTPHGELFLCVPQATQQARQYHVSLSHEIARLTVHGFLHIYGYDHQKKHERGIMRSAERAILCICKKENLF